MLHFSGNSEATSPQGYLNSPRKYFSRPPILQSMLPRFGSVAGGSKITIKGQGLSSTVACTFGSRDLLMLLSKSDEEVGRRVVVSFDNRIQINGHLEVNR